MQEITYWVDGQFVAASKAVIPLNSRGYRLGDGVFDTERTFNGKLFRLDAHLERLERSLKFTRIELGMSLDDLGGITQQTLERNLPLLDRYGDFWVTQTVSRGGGKNVLDAAPPLVSIIVEPLPFARYAPYYDRGIPLVAPALRSTAQQGMDPKLKAISRLNMVLIDLEAKQVDPESLGLLLDEQGNIAEVIYGNLFVVRGGTIRTPASRSILEGVTRDTTIGLARKRGLTVAEAELQLYDLVTADEAFVTTTSYCVMPVGKVNGAPVGKAVPGAVTRKVMDAWCDLVGMDYVAQMKTQAARAASPLPAARAAGRAGAR
jgi:branched-chain amino acid aminotransferase